LLGDSPSQASWESARILAYFELLFTEAVKVFVEDSGTAWAESKSGVWISAYALHESGARCIGVIGKRGSDNDFMIFQVVMILLLRHSVIRYGRLIIDNQDLIWLRYPRLPIAMFQISSLGWAEVALVSTQTFRGSELSAVKCVVLRQVESIAN
jgi:hypothetical protein